MKTDHYYKGIHYIEYQGLLDSQPIVKLTAYNFKLMRNYIQDLEMQVDKLTGKHFDPLKEKGEIKMTRKEKFFEIFPEASRYDDNLPNVSPCQLDRNFAGNFCEDETCYLCRKKFWNQEVDERDSFMNF